MVLILKSRNFAKSWISKKIEVSQLVNNQKNNQNKKKKIFARKTLNIGLSKYVKIKDLPTLHFPEKIGFLFAIFELFLVGKRAGSQVQDSESKLTNIIPNQLNVKKFWSQHFSVLRL